MDAVTANNPCNVPNTNVVSVCGLSELISVIHCDDKTDHHAFFLRTCVEEDENANYATPPKPLFSMRGEQPLDGKMDPRSRFREYVESKRRVVAKGLCYARPTRSSWRLNEGQMGKISQIKEDVEHTNTPWQPEVDLKLMESVLGAHPRTPEEDKLSEECVCVPPQACLCCPRRPEIFGRDLLYAY